ncbi:hypothetical protein ACT2CI_00085 [Candidatus Vidania fulgoroideorum]
MYKRKYSQVFLIDKNIILKILNNLKLSKFNIEMCSGFDNILHYSFNRKKIILIEKDKKIFNFLKNKYKKTKVIVKNTDAIKYKINKASSIICNIPYNNLKNFINYFLNNNRKIIFLNISIPYNYNKKIINNFYFIYYYKILKKIFLKKDFFFPKPKIDSLFLIFKKKKNKYKIVKSKKFFKNFFKKKSLNFKEIYYFIITQYRLMLNYYKFILNKFIIYDFLKIF